MNRDFIFNQILRYNVAHKVYWFTFFFVVTNKLNMKNCRSHGRLKEKEQGISKDPQRLVVLIPTQPVCSNKIAFV